MDDLSEPTPFLEIRVKEFDRVDHVDLAEYSGFR
jgi:hypothetical protein